MTSHSHPAEATPLRLRVLFADTDAMGVVYHSRFFPWFEAGRGEFVRARGYSYREMEVAGVGLAVIEAHCVFRSAARYDDILLLYTWLGDLSRVRVRFRYTLYHEADNRLLAEAETLHTFIDRDGRPLRITHYPAVWTRLQALGGPTAE